jgi:hypothetical protein
MSATRVSIGYDVVVHCYRVDPYESFPASWHADLYFDEELVMVSYAAGKEPYDFWISVDDEETISEGLFAQVAPYLPQFIEVARKFRRDHP